MRVKRYVVNTLPEAVQMIRTDLGKDAVILETKEIKVGGVLGLFRKKKIEVLAAVEPSLNQQTDKKKPDKTDVELVLEQILKATQKGRETQSEETSSPVVNHATEEPTKMTAVNAKPSAQEPIPNLLNQTYNRNTATAQATKTTAIKETAAKTISVSEPVKVEGVGSLEQQPEKEEQLFSSSTAMSKTEQFILKELKHLRLEMKAMSQQQDERKGESVNISQLRTHLFDQELSTEWINTLCESLQHIEETEQRLLELDEIWAVAKKQLLEWLLPFSKATIEATTKVIQLVGPTGVGKTTTIAKLAANYSITHNKKVGFITADTYRIAAVEQLRTYANILNLPLEVVFSHLDLTRAYKQLESCEMILMDTAGRNFKSDLFVSEVNSLIANTQFSEGILVVSLTSRTRDMALVAEKFGKFGIRKVVFTKLDEANAYGSIFNMIMQFGLQPLFITSGQNVPDDIEPFSIENYVNLLLGEANHERSS